MASVSTGFRVATSDTVRERRRTARNVHRGSATAILLAGVAFVLTLAGCDSEALQASQSSERDTALRILQTDARLLAFADVQRQLETGRSLLGGQDGYREMVDDAMTRIGDMTGIRMDEDVRGMYVGIQEGNQTPSGGMVAFVDHDSNTLAQQAADMEGMVRMETTWPVDAFALESQERRLAIAFAEGSLILMASDPSMLEAMLDRAYGESRPAVIDPMLAAVAARNSWVMVRDAGTIFAAESSADGSAATALIRPLLSGIGDMAMGVDSDGQTVSAEIIIRPAEGVSTEDYESLLRGVRAMMRMQFGQLETASNLVERIDIDAETDWVSLRITTNIEEMALLEEEIREELQRRMN
jgi:hypothetical protein